MIAEDKALLQNGDFQAVVFVKGVDSNYAEVSGVPQKMVRGNFNLGTAEDPRMVMGVGIENAVGIMSDRALLPLTLYLPKKGVKDISDPLDALSEGLVIPSGSFAIQQDFDNKYLITNIDFTKLYLNFQKDEYSAVEIAVTEEKLVEEVKSEIKKILGSIFFSSGPI
jgi:lipoprotein-releasing system permease protein